MYIPIEPVLKFLNDEGLDRPIRIKHADSERWSISINEPWECDNKMRCGLAAIEKDGNKFVVFNSFKAVANFGDAYKGDFFKFVKLVKNLTNTREAKSYFLRNYLLKSTADIKQFLIAKEQQESAIIKPHTEIVLPETYERLDYADKSHLPFIKFLERTRNVPRRVVQTTRIFIDQKTQRVIFPIYRDQQLIFWATRSIRAKSPMPWIHSDIKETYPIWNLENISGDSVMIFEGILDAIHVPNGVAILGAGKWHELIDQILAKDFRKIIVAMDGDHVGLLNRIRIANDLSMQHNNVYIYNFYGLPTDDKGKVDFGWMAQNNIPFDLDKRIIQWNLKANLLLKMKKIT